MVILYHQKCTLWSTAKILFFLWLDFSNNEIQKIGIKYFPYPYRWHFLAFLSVSGISQYQVYEPIRSWSQRHFARKEKVLLLIVESRDVCSILPQRALRQWTTEHKERSTEKHTEGQQSTLSGSDDLWKLLKWTIPIHSFSSEFTCVNLPFTAIKGDTVLLLHVWINHLPQWRCLFQNL